MIIFAEKSVKRKIAENIVHPTHIPPVSYTHLDEMNAILKKTGAEKGDVILIVADKIKNHVLTVLGALRDVYKRQK